MKKFFIQKYNKILFDHLQNKNILIQNHVTSVTSLSANIIYINVKNVILRFVSNVTLMLKAEKDVIVIKTLARRDVLYVIIIYLTGLSANVNVIKMSGCVRSVMWW